MIKKVVLALLEIIIVLVVGVIFLIGFSGGFTLSLGGLSINAHNLKNPLIMLIAALILRRLLCGAFLRGGFLQQQTDRLADNFVASPRVRKIFGLACAAMLVIMIASILANPLQRGLVARYYDNHGWEGTPLMTRRENSVNLWRIQSEYPGLTEQYSIQWAGVLYAPVAGRYTFSTLSDDGSELLLNDRSVVDNEGVHELRERSGSTFVAQGFHPFSLYYTQWNGDAHIKLVWQPPGKDRESIAPVHFFAETPSPLAFSIGRFLEVLYAIVKTALLFVLFATITSICLSHQIISPFWRQSRIGRRWRTWFLNERVPALGVPELPTKRMAPFWLALIAYTLLSLIWTYPLIIHFSTKMLGLGGDRYIALWNMWWMKKALLELQTNPLYTDYLFYPKGISLEFHDFSIFNSLLSVPLQYFFSLSEIYNLLYLFTFIAGGFGCFLLVRYLTGDDLAAFLSGIVFAFWGGRAYYVDHLSLASIQWFPYCTLYLIKTLRESTYRNPVLAAIFLVINALSSLYYAVYMLLFAGLLILYAAWAERSTFFTAACLKRLSLIAMLSLLMLISLYYPMLIQIVTGQSYMNSQAVIEDSAKLNNLLLPNSNHAILGKYIRYWCVKAGLPIQWGLAGGIFIGYLVLSLCIYAGIRLRYVKHIFWILAAIIFLLLAFGPYPQIFSTHYTWLPLPYNILQRIPGLKAVRIPVRFMVLVMFCCSVLTGYACWDIFRRIRLRKSVFVIFMLIVLFEYVRGYYVNPLEDIPELYQTLGQEHEDYAILELTRLMNWEHSSVRASLFQTAHEKKLFHGHVSRVSLESYHQAYLLYPVFEDVLGHPQALVETEPILSAEQHSILPLLAQYNVRYVALYQDYPHGNYDDNRQRLTELFGLPVDEQYNITFFKVPSVDVSTTLIFPGVGMFPLDYTDAIPVRQAALEADINILNMEGYRQVQLQCEARSTIMPQETVEISVNGRLIHTTTVEDWAKVALPPIAIQEGENTIRFRTRDNGHWKYGVRLRHIDVTLLK